MNWQWTRRLGRRLGQVAGGLVVIELIFACTGVPPVLRHWLTGSDCESRAMPRYVIVLGGAGIPSGSSLLRAYYAAEFGRGLTGTTFVVALPADNDPDHSSVGRLRDELVLRGIPARQVLMETHGRNTYQQAANIRRLLGGEAGQQPTVIVTSGFHMRRALLCFRKQGFERLAILGATGIDAEADPGWGAYLRYQVWSNMEASLDMFRELLAMVAYKVHGWI